MVSGQLVEFIILLLLAIFTLVQDLKEYGSDKGCYSKASTCKNILKFIILSILNHFRSQARVRMAERGRMVHTTCWPEAMFWRE